MKKSLIALALIGAFSGAAVAQSNVTLYGILDVNVQRNDPEVGSSTTGINGGHQSGNRWGVRGTEALGGGMSAIFTLEGGFSIDTGTLGQSSAASGNRIFGRQAWAGLQWDAAKLALVAGRIASFSSGTGSFDFFGQVDPFVTGFGDSSLGSTFTSAGALRTDNTVAIVGGPWAGFRAGAGYSFNVVGGEAAGSGNNTTAIVLGAAWSGGPFMAGVTYDIIDVAQAGVPASGIPAGAPDEKHLQIGGTFDLKFVKLHAAYAKEDNVYFTIDGSGGPVLNTIDPGADADSWMLGVTVPLFGGQLLASYQDRDGDPVSVRLGTATTPVTRERDLSVWAIGYTYPLSRRTNLYVNYSDRDGEKSAQGNASVDRTQATLGIRHLF